MDKIPILHVINECDDGSISRIVERIIRFAPRDRFRWYVCATRGLYGFEKIYSDLGAEVENGVPDGDAHTATTERVIRDMIQKNKIRIVHSHTPRTIMAVWKAEKSLAGGLEDHPVHIATKHLLTTPRDRNLGLFYTLYDRLSLYPPDHIVTVSNRMAEQVKSQPGIPGSKITSIPNSIPAADFYRPDLRDAFRASLNLSPEAIVVGFSGRIQKVKNLDYLIRAFARLAPDYPNLHLALAGEGDMKDSLEQLANRLGVGQRVTWLGFTRYIPGFLSAIDIYVQPSLNEGLSLSILEAMAAGKPVIATRVGSADEIIRNNSYGLIIPPSNTADIVQAMKTLLDHPATLQQMASNGRAHVLATYNIEKMVTQYINLYLSLNEGRGH